MNNLAGVELHGDDGEGKPVCQFDSKFKTKKLRDGFTTADNDNDNDDDDDDDDAYDDGDNNTRTNQENYHSWTAFSISLRYILLKCV